MVRSGTHAGTPYGVVDVHRADSLLMPRQCIVEPHDMAQVLDPGSIVVADWHRSADSKEFFSRILHKKKRRNFGMFLDLVAAKLPCLYIIHTLYRTQLALY